MSDVLPESSFCLRGEQAIGGALHIKVRASCVLKSLTKSFFPGDMEGTESVQNFEKIFCLILCSELCSCKLTVSPGR